MLLKVKQRIITMIFPLAILGLPVPFGWGEDSPQPHAVRSRRDLQAVLDKAPKDTSQAAFKPLAILLLTDVKDHGENEHDYPLWQERWARLLGGSTAWGKGPVSLYGQTVSGQDEEAGAAGVNVLTAQQWPSGEQFRIANVIVAFCYLQWNVQRIEQMKAYLARGRGLVLIHSAAWTLPQPSAEVKAVAGVGGFQYFRHGLVKLQIDVPDHPICRGLPTQIEFHDETYWPPTPGPNAPGFVALASSQERIKPDEGAMQFQVMFWTHQQGAGRVFGCVPGHYTWTFDDPYLRILLLRGIAWAAGHSPYRFDSLALSGVNVK